MANGMEQAVPQQAVPQQGQAVPQQGAGVFPQNDEEGETFILQVVKMIHADEEVKSILQEKTGGAAPTSAILGALAAQLLTLLFTKLYEQTGGQQVSEQFVVEIIRVCVKEIADIADAIGLETTVKDEQAAAQVAGDTLDTAMQELYSGGGAQQGQPQGMLQGGM